MGGPLVIWFPGVRRAGKTTICRSLKDVEYFDCELPRQRREMEDPEAFLKGLEGKRVVLDEVHRLPNPSELFRRIDTDVERGIFEATRFARSSEVSRTTIANYLSILETTFVAHVVRPYSTGKIAEIVAAPKVYGFDTGFVCYFCGWHEPRRDDTGLLWEHYVLNHKEI
jgi:predicted AAA+ superfamily ATPase